MKRLYLLFLTIFCGKSLSTSPTPSRSLGFMYKGGKANAPVQLEAFVDLTCPDSRTVWPVLKEIAEFYGQDKLRLIVYLFPLPYHRNAHIAASSAFYVRSKNSSLAFDWMTILFNEQNTISNQETWDETMDDVVGIIAALAQEVNIEQESLRKGMTDRRYDHEARLSFKFGCTRGVNATPYYFMNGAFLKNDTPLWQAHKWKEAIDSVLKTKT